MHYDEDCVGRTDLPFYLALARAMGASRVIDIGAGTGLLAGLLAARGHVVIGVEPQPTMLELARAQPDAASVRWIQGTADDLPAGWADLVIMTGHVAQYFLDDPAWLRVLSAARRAQRPNGRLVFEIRNRDVEAWRDWADDEPARTAAGTRRTTVGRVGDLVTHVDHWTRGSHTWTTTETLRFPTWDAMTAGLAAAGFEIIETWGDFDGSPIGPTSPEWIVLAGLRRPARPARSAGPPS